MLKALVIFPPAKAYDLGDLLQISRAEAMKREHREGSLAILAVHYVSELQVYVAIYEFAEAANNEHIVVQKAPGVGAREVT
jgi:hypothetical protein